MEPVALNLFMNQLNLISSMRFELQEKKKEDTNQACFRVDTGHVDPGVEAHGGSFVGVVLVAEELQLVDAPLVHALFIQSSSIQSGTSSRSEETKRKQSKTHVEGAYDCACP